MTPTANPREFIQLTFQVLREYLPQDRAGDNLFSFLVFCYFHNRKPTQELLFNDVMYKIKVSDEILNALRVFTTDKEHVKSYISAKVGKQYCVPTLSVLKSEKEIEAYDFKSDICIKPTHMSGKFLFSNKRANPNVREIKRWLTLNYYTEWREANYRTLVPKIIVEPILFQDENIIDYRFHCYEGKPKLIMVDFGRGQNHTRMVYDVDWVPQNIVLGYPIASHVVERPKNFREMKEVSAELAKEFGYVRIDMYSDQKDCYVGEITHCHSCANQRFQSRDHELFMSRLLFS